MYFDLWTRVFDEGIVTIIDESACAFSAGYIGTRAERTWGEHMLKLKELGFILAQPAGNREFAHVLLRNPLRVAAELRQKRSSAITDEWWNAFVSAHPGNRSQDPGRPKRP